MIQHDHDRTGQAACLKWWMPISAAWMTAVVTQFVLKVHCGCDLVCDHCYVYEHANRSRRRKNATMHLDTVSGGDDAARRPSPRRAAGGMLTRSCAVELLLGAERLRAAPASVEHPTKVEARYVADRRSAWLVEIINDATETEKTVQRGHYSISAPLHEGVAADDRHQLSMMDVRLSDDCPKWTLIAKVYSRQ